MKKLLKFMVITSVLIALMVKTLPYIVGITLIVIAGLMLRKHLKKAGN
ncbi:hypothetical protein [Lactobacillus phage Sabazios]|nr:hypothetical protein [Lactobacillus phage Silenus]AYH91866.1 hypothetical protein [Lactobacillus phage Sabazios]